MYLPRIVTRSKRRKRTKKTPPANRPHQPGGGGDFANDGRVIVSCYRPRPISRMVMAREAKTPKRENPGAGPSQRPERGDGSHLFTATVSMPPGCGLLRLRAQQGLYWGNLLKHTYWLLILQCWLWLRQPVWSSSKLSLS